MIHSSHTNVNKPQCFCFVQWLCGALIKMVSADLFRGTADDHAAKQGAGSCNKQHHLRAELLAQHAANGKRGKRTDRYRGGKVALRADGILALDHSSAAASCTAIDTAQVRPSSKLMRLPLKPCPMR